MYKKIQEISKNLKSNFFFDYDIYKSTWFQAGGRCDFFCIVENIDELKMNIQLMDHAIPDALWNDLDDQGLTRKI